MTPDRSEPRARRSRSRRPFPVHHILFALVPTLFLYSYNTAKLPVAPSEMVLPLVASAGVALLLWLVLWLLMRSSRKAALSVTLFLALFFGYGRIVALVGPNVASDFQPVVAGGVLLLGVVLIGLLSTEFAGLTIFLNLASLALVIINLALGGPAFLRARTRPPLAPRPASAASAGTPDIYYIVLDGYARADVLDSVYNYDNSAFISWLEQNGFQVARDSRSNYSQTYLSLASSLNMTYLDSVARRLKPESDSRSPLVRMIGDSRVVNELRQRGYTIVSVASGYTGTDLSDADIHLAPRWAFSEFQNVLISTTALPLVLDRVLKRSQHDLHRERILYAFEHLADAAKMKHPVFVFCHIVSPHPPFVFGASGDKAAPQEYFTMTEGGTFQTVDKEKVRQEYVEKYRAQLRFITTRTKAAVERILAASPKPPVIILQADHGPGSVLNWNDPEPAELSERFAILNAYHIPQQQAPLPDSLSPVNSFRLVFNQLFASGYPLLPDKSWFSTIARPWRFYDVDRPGDYLKSDEALRVSMVAFRGELRSENPAAYCRRLVALLYPGRSVTIERFYVQGLHLPPETADDAYRLYRDAVAAGQVPDFGTQYESYAGPGPDRIPVAALVFSDSTP